MNFELYINQLQNWPPDGRHILANYNENSIIVYQAYKPSIAKAICKNQNFHSEECIQNGYSMNRMTWIKTNFLWMMFRSGWATKKDQECILAIRVKLDGFDELLKNSVRTSHHNNDQSNSLIKNSDVVLQWDPDHKPGGEKVETGRRAIQLGLRGEALKNFSNNYILDITDVTNFVNKQYNNCFTNGKFTNPNLLEIPIEKVYIPNDLNIVKHINLSV